MRRRRRRTARKLLTALLLALAALLFASAAPVLLLRYLDPPTTSFMLQRRIEARRAGRDDFAIRQQWVPLASLPAHVPVAVLSSEDQRFFSHSGFDVRAVKHALGAHLQGGELRGASTITQQVAKNLFLWEGRSLLRKGLEGYFTVLLELCWPKRRILEVYLNVAELGDGVFGIGAAARHHFGHDERRLTAGEAALLAAILPSPRTRDPRQPSAQVLRKQRWILQQMRVLPAYERGLSARLRAPSGV